MIRLDFNDKGYLVVVHQCQDGFWDEFTVCKFYRWSDSKLVHEKKVRLKSEMRDVRLVGNHVTIPIVL